MEKFSLEAKQQWLILIQLSGKRYDRDSMAQYQSFIAEHNSMTRWLIGVPPRPDEDTVKDEAEGL
jgi:hypothetical protein